MSRFLGVVAACLLAIPAPLAAQASVLDSIPEGRWSADDWRILQAKVREATTARLDTLPLNLTIAAIARTFVGTPYVPGTLEQPGPEHLVINLRELDCVTFVENVLALTAFVRHDGVSALADSADAMRRYAGYLRRLRYRDGRVDGYASRLHYFSEWLQQAEADHRLRLVTRGLGGTDDTGLIDFMTTHAASYPALQDSLVFREIRDTEIRLSSGPGRVVLPKDRIAPIAGEIQEGDVIAAASTLQGLDVVHTGFAVREHGELHLLHAPLKGSSVEISALPLAERIQGISTQRGIMVARPQPEWFQSP
jgi:hypothetical protein